jgi:hypothetical protein
MRRRFDLSLSDSHALCKRSSLADAHPRCREHPPEPARGHRRRVIAFPLSIALAVAVGVPPIAGLYTAVIAGGIAAAFGGSRFNITGPTAALVPVLSHAVVIHGPKALPLLGLMAGVMLLVMSALRAGRLVRYIPGTVVVGFTAGIALSMRWPAQQSEHHRHRCKPRTLPRPRLDSARH